MQGTILEGPKILFTEIIDQINLFSGTEELRALQQNCYFAHLKNLLLAMLGDEDKTVRAKAVNVVQKTRYAEVGNQDGERDPVREFYIPRCKFAATSYVSIIGEALCTSAGKKISNGLEEIIRHKKAAHASQ